MSEPYVFNSDDVRRFASTMGASVRPRGDELQFKECPYCHSTKDRYTFSINLKTGMFKCMRASCGAHGNMITLHRDFGFDLGVDVSEYERPSYSWRRFKTPEEPIESKPEAIEYLHDKRMISEEVIRRYEITVRKDNPRILVFPFFDESGEMVFIKYRDLDYSKDKSKSKEWCESNSKAILFGMKQCDPSQGRLIITEGQIDSLSVATAGFLNAVSVPTGKNGMTWIPHCWDWLHNFTEIVVFGDYERGAMTLLPQIRARFDWMRIRAVRPEDYKGCKDANEILKQYGVDAVQNAVKNAAPIMLDQVKLLSEVEYEDDDDGEMIPTEITEIDKLLMGGLRFGYLDILTGKRGDGKSTFGSMILRSALRHGYNSFIYSGEMKTSDVKKWLDRQIAGSRIVIDASGGNAEYPKWTLSAPNLETIRMWYKDRAYIYDTSVVTESKTDLIDIVETYMSQFGCRFVLIDNLMTAIDLVNIDGTKFEKQEAICKKLARLATKYNAVILLIAHKKKKQKDSFDEDENDDVLGSSEITNLAGVILSYGRDKNIDEDQRLIKVTKERVNGKVNFDGIIVNYDDPSKRIYGDTPEEIAQKDAPCECFPKDTAAETEFQAVDDIGDIPF